MDLCRVGNKEGRELFFTVGRDDGISVGRNDGIEIMDGLCEGKFVGRIVLWRRKVGIRVGLRELVGRNVGVNVLERGWTLTL